MSDSLLPLCPAHDPGGKSKRRLPPGVEGGATFAGPFNEYRTVLWRRNALTHWSEPYALWIGMNPSTADVHVDDPTCAREWRFTSRLMGLRHYRKVNVSAYRATDPRDLLTTSVEIDTPLNRATILKEAAGAVYIIVAWGTLKGRMRSMAAEIALSLAGCELWCLGTTRDGSPRHPLYVAGDVWMKRWQGWGGRWT